jgi:hypothetical protein
MAFSILNPADLEDWMAPLSPPAVAEEPLPEETPAEEPEVAPETVTDE